jgi:hypothetical protein
MVVLAVSACATPTPPPPTRTPELLPLPTLTGFRTPSPVGATPVIIASATPTATPFTHVIQRGETLLGIAFRYGVSLEALQQVNPDVNARSLQIGQALIIPLTDDLAALQAAGLPTPMPFEVGQPSCFTTAGDSLYCLVEVRNPGPQALENVAIRVVLADSAGQPITSSVAYAGLEVIPPGGSAPAAALFNPVPAGVAAQGSDPVSAYPSSEPGGRYVPLELVQYTAESADGVWLVSGEARNTTDRPARVVRVVVGLIAPGGRLAGYRQQTLGGELAPGASLTFSLPVTPLTREVNQYVVWLEGEA